MSSVPLGELALDRLRTLADGNGVLPSEIDLLSCAAADYEIKGRLTLRLAAAPKTVRQFGIATAATDVVRCKSFAELAAAVQEAGQSPPPAWIDIARKVLHDTQNDGWGFEGDFALPGLVRRFMATEACIVCHGQGHMACNTCHGQGTRFCPMCRQQTRIACRTCHGSGRSSSDSQMPCPTCQGQTTEPCPQCNARGVVNCPDCNGKKNTACQDCRATGRLTETAEVAYTVAASFGLLGDQDLPQTLLRAIDRGGLANLARGHATINAQEPDAKEGGVQSIAISANLSFGDARFRITGKAVEAQILGLKGAILGLPPFLDDALTDGLKALRATAAGHTHMAPVLRYRLLKEALLWTLRQPKAAETNLIRQYPVGVSRPLIKEIVGLARQTLILQSRHARWIASGGVLALFCLFCWMYFNGPIRPWAVDVLPARLLDPFDFLLPVVGIAGLWGAIIGAQIWVLRRKLGLGRNVVLPRRRIGKSFFVFAAIIVLIWAAILVDGIHAPTWFKMMKIKYEAGILFD